MTTWWLGNVGDTFLFVIYQVSLLLLTTPESFRLPAKIVLPRFLLLSAPKVSGAIDVMLPRFLGSPVRVSKVDHQAEHYAESQYPEVLQGGKTEGMK